MKFKILCPPLDPAAKLQFCFFGKSAYELDFLICKMGIRKCGLFFKDYVCKNGMRSWSVKKGSENILGFESINKDGPLFPSTQGLSCSRFSLQVCDKPVLSHKFEQHLASVEEEADKCPSNPPTLLNLESLWFFVPKSFWLVGSITSVLLYSNCFVLFLSINS